MVDGGVLASLMMFTTLQSWPEIHARLRLNGRMENRKEVQRPPEAHPREGERKVGFNENTAM